jgi:hypothetical protein
MRLSLKRQGAIRIIIIGALRTYRMNGPAHGDDGDLTIIGLAVATLIADEIIAYLTKTNVPL